MGISVLDTKELEEAGEEEGGRFARQHLTETAEMRWLQNSPYTRSFM